VGSGWSSVEGFVEVVRVGSRTSWTLALTKRITSFASLGEKRKHARNAPKSSKRVTAVTQLSIRPNQTGTMLSNKRLNPLQVQIGDGADGAPSTPTSLGGAKMRHHAHSAIFSESLDLPRPATATSPSRARRRLRSYRWWSILHSVLHASIAIASCIYCDMWQGTAIHIVL
jgi:hypothetical protein